eukprot:271633-Amphidinium_carterae.1
MDPASIIAAIAQEGLHKVHQCQSLSLPGGNSLRLPPPSIQRLKVCGLGFPLSCRKRGILIQGFHLLNSKA